MMTDHLTIFFVHLSVQIMSGLADLHQQIGQLLDEDNTWHGKIKFECGTEENGWGHCPLQSCRSCSFHATPSRGPEL